MGRAHWDALLYSILGAVIASLLGWTMLRHPLFPLRWHEHAWCKAWLATTVVDFYGLALPFSALILAAESNQLVGIAWVLGVLLLGSPVACVWMARCKLRGVQ